jgi:thiopurine S-methyltransferase
MWRAKWRSARELGADPGFHLPHAHPALVRYKTLLLGAGVTSPPEQSKRVFVPLCGRSVDLVFLAACGHRVLGVEMDASACESFFEKSGLPRTTATAHRAPSRRDHTNGSSVPSDEGSGSASRDWDGWGAGVRRVHSSGNVAVVEGDVFSLRAAPDPAPDPDPSSRRSRPFGLPTPKTARGAPAPESGAEASGSVPWGDAFASPKRFAFRVRATLSGARKDPDVVKVFSPGGASEFSGDSDSDARIGTRGSISFAEEALRFAEGGGPAMDAVWDRGALVAVEPSLRPRYAELVAGRLAPGGKMLLVATERGYSPRYGPRRARTERDGDARTERDGDARTERDGDARDERSSRPPHDVSHAEVRRLYEPLGLAVERLATRDAIETAPGWMREEGVESLAESVYLLTKRVESRRGGGGAARARKGLW